jgi:threonyl-tRNA synthetase
MFLSLRHLAAKVLAAAAQELFKDVILVEGRGTSLGFYYDFIFPFAFKNEFLAALEEKMRFLIKEKKPIEVFEMVPQNAGQFLLYHGQPVRAEKIARSGFPLVRMFQMGSFRDYLETSDSLAAIDQLGAFKLQGIALEGEITRIMGTAFFDKQQLKEFLKKNKKINFFGHNTLGQQLELFIWKEKDLLWKPKGETLREILLTLFKQHYRAQGFEWVKTSQSLEELFSTHLYLHQQNELSRLVEIVTFQDCKDKHCCSLFESFPKMTDRAHYFYTAGEPIQEMISSLQSMVKILKMLGFEHEVVLVSASRLRLPSRSEKKILTHVLRACQIRVREEVGQVESSQLEVRVEDALGTKWLTSFLKVDEGRKVIVQSLFVSLERMIALLLERYRGELPFWLAPEQVRIFALKGCTREAAWLSEHLSSLDVRATLDDRNEALSERMHQALLEKVPYVVCIGKREQNGWVRVRRLSSKKEESMRIEQLKELIDYEKQRK